MAITRVRDVIRDAIDESSLEHFETMCIDVDKLRKSLVKETNKEQAHNKAVAWASSVLGLARIESALLSSVLPLIEADIEVSDRKIAKLNQEKAEAEDLVYSLRKSPNHPVPLSPTVNKADAERKAEATLERNQILYKVGDQLHELTTERRPILQSIGQIKVMIRALRKFSNSHFPTPMKPNRSPMAPSVVDPDGDPLVAYADRWVASMDGRNSPSKLERQAEALTKARNAYA
jgi:hypothetical protein